MDDDREERKAFDQRRGKQPCAFMPWKETSIHHLLFASSMPARIRIIHHVNTSRWSLTKHQLEYCLASEINTDFLDVSTTDKENPRKAEKDFLSYFLSQEGERLATWALLMVSFRQKVWACEQKSVSLAQSAFLVDEQLTLRSDSERIDYGWSILTSTVWVTVKAALKTCQ